MKNSFQGFLKHWKLYLFSIAAILTIAGLLIWHFQKPSRIHREHALTVAEEFEYLTNRNDIHSIYSNWCSKKEAKQDLDELEWLLENRYSYLKLKEVDYKNALDSIRSSLGDGITRGALAIQLRKFIALFGDGHSMIGDPDIKRLFPGFLPFLVEQSENRLIAFKTDRSDFLEPKYPYISKIDGVELDKWLQAAGEITPKGSVQMVKLQTTRNLRLIQYLRAELGLKKSGTVEIELESADTQSRKTILLDITDQWPVYGSWPNTKSQILPENIGYLRIPGMLHDQEFLDELVEYMNQFHDTQGLIIDIRGNGGGSRASLRVLLPFFMASNDPPKVVNIAAYRLGHRKDILDARWLYPENFSGWSSQEKVAVRDAADRFQPQWELPRGEFSDWHYFVIGPRREKDCYYYNRPTVILMDTSNFSASDIFLGAFKDHPKVTLMGTASGGGSGRYQNYRLHNNMIAVSLSSMASFQPNGKLYDGNGIQPDIIVEPVPTDFIGQTDTVLDAAINFIKKN